MSIFEIQHPLGQDIEKIHGAMMAGFEERKDLLSEHTDFTFVDALSNGRGVSVFTVANWVTRNQAMVEIPVAVSEDDEEWKLNFDDSDPETVLQRVTIKDMLGRGFEIHDLKGGLIGASWVLRFDITKSGILFGYEIEEPRAAPFGQYESSLYDNYAKLARTHGSLGELAILAEVI